MFAPSRSLEPRNNVPLGFGRGACTHKSAFCKRGSVNVRFAPKATELLRRRELTRCANRRHMPCSKKILFDHFVGPYQERFRDLKAKRLRSFEIDHQLELG